MRKNTSYVQLNILPNNPKINASTSQCPVNYHQGLKKNTEKDDSNYLVCNKKENETHNKKEIEKAKGEKRMK